MKEPAELQVYRKNEQEALTFVSLMAANADALYRQLCTYLASVTGQPIVVLDQAAWQERALRIEQGKVDIAAVCGAAYVRYLQSNMPYVRLLAAPVMAGSRYNDQPVYFSDVVVRADAPFHSFADLFGARWVFNEPGSYSGYAVVLARLSEQQLDPSYFGQVLESGSHAASLEYVLKGRADVAAIDSIVLARACELDPTLCDRLRVIDTLGPSPVPPLLFTSNVQPERGALIQHALLHMHESEDGRAMLHAAKIARFAHASDEDYNGIRHKLDLAQKALEQHVESMENDDDRIHTNHSALHIYQQAHA